MLTCESLRVFFFSSRRRHTRWPRDWSSDVCSSDLVPTKLEFDGDSVIVEIFGHKAFSSSRVVRAGNDFYMEYQFVRSEERRVGKECRCRRGTEHGNKK